MALAIVVLLLGACSEGRVETFERDASTPPADATAPKAADVGVGPGGVDSGPDAQPDAGTAGQDAGPSDYAGTYAIGPLDFGVYSEQGHRDVKVVYDEPSDRFVVAYVRLLGEGLPWRTNVQTVRYDPAAPQVSPAVTLDDEIRPEQYSLTTAIASGGGRLLALLEDNRLGVPGPREIYGQLLQLDASGAPQKIGANFDITNEPALEEHYPCAGFEPGIGKFLVAWGDDRELATTPEQRVTWARFVGVDGSVGPEMRLGGDERWQNGCAIAPGQGRFLVAWSDYVLNGSDLNCGYHARFVDGSGPVGAPFVLAQIGNAVVDPPAVAYNSRADEFLVVWVLGVGGGRYLDGAILRPDGSLRKPEFLVTTHTEGTWGPNLAYNPRTNSYLLTFHAMSSTEGYAVELSPDGTPASAAVSFNATRPPDTGGTYFSPVAASTKGSRFLVAIGKNWLLVDGTFFTSLNALP